MKMKEAQLLGILAIIAGGIIILSMWGSRPESQQTGGKNGAPTKDASNPSTETSEGEALDNWQWLTEEEQQEAEAEDEAEEDPGAASLSVEGEAEDVSPGGFDPGASLDVTMGWGEDMTEKLEESGPAEIGLHEKKKKNPMSDIAPPAPQKPDIYEVKKGDTLVAISRKFYDTPAKWRKILEANKAVLKRPEDLRPDMKLVIPDPSNEVSRAQNSSDSQKPLLAGDDQDDTEAPRHYTARKKDTLWSLAEKFYGNGKDYKKILKANDDLLDKPSDLKEDMKLVIPE
jgi:nucleoid-associated protein YgaU